MAEHQLPKLNTGVRFPSSALAESPHTLGILTFPANIFRVKPGPRAYSVPRTTGSEGDEPRFAALVWTAAVSGLRFGELTALDRARVDLDAGAIRVDRALAQINGQGPTFGVPKSDAAFRTVAIPEQICDVLRTHIDTYVDPEPTAILFTSVTGSLLVNRYFAPYWHRAKLAAAVDSGVRFHDLRHLAGTTAATAGASLREVMARMGHASSDASLRYLKAAETRDRAIAEAIGAHLRSQ